MNPVRALAATTATVALVLTAATTVPAVAARPSGGAPSGVETTIKLTRDGHQVRASGRAAPGARVYTQDRYTRHQRWVTRQSTTAGRNGRFTLSFDTGARNDATYRTCVKVPGRDRCTRGKRADIEQRAGKVQVLEQPTELRPGVAARIVVKVNRWLLARPAVLQYQDPATGTWTDSVHRRDWPTGYTGAPEPKKVYDLAASELPAGGTALPVRILVRGTDEIATAVSQPWTVLALRDRPLTTFSVTSGSVLVDPQLQTVGGLNNPQYTVAVAPAGATATNTATLALPQGCRTLTGAVTNRYDADPAAPRSASIALDGVPAWSYTVGGSTYSLDVTGRSQVTLTSSYDAASGVRLWFGSLRSTFSSNPPAPGPTALCAS